MPKDKSKPGYVDELEREAKEIVSKMSVIEAVAINNPAAYMLGRLLRLKYPQVQEQAEYSTQAEALTILMKVSHLNREQLAFRLGVSVPMIDKATAGTYGGNFHSETLEKCEELARLCNLPVMVKFFHVLKTYSLKNVKRGVMRDPTTDWWKDQTYERRR